MNLIHGEIVGPGKNAFGLWQQTTGGKGHCFEGKAELSGCTTALNIVYNIRFYGTVFFYKYLLLSVAY